MSKLQKLVSTVIKNKVILFVFSRYGTYIIHFINSLLIAAYLGPFYLGIWGFITLVTSYMHHLNFGIADSVTAIISVKKEKEFYVQKVIGTAITMLLGLSVVAILLFSINYIFQLNLGSRYNFLTYSPIVVLIGVLAYFNNLFNHIFRAYGKLFEIAFSQTVFPLLMLSAIIFFKDRQLLWAMLFANLFAYLLAFLMYAFRSPVNLKPIFIFKLFKFIQIKGWHLFVYNTSFYFIIITTRSFVSGYYSVKEFGYFTFAFTLANVMLLLLQSMAYLIYPKMLNRFAKESDAQNIKILQKLRDAYVTTSHLLIHLAILFFPFLLVLFPEYIEATGVFKLIALSILLYTNSFGYSGLLIAKGYEKQIGRLSFTALLLNIVGALILINVFNVPFSLVILSTMFSYFIYVFILGKLGMKMLNLDNSFIEVIKDIYPLRLLVPYALSLVFIIFAFPNNYLAISFALFLILNYKVLLNLKLVLKSVIVNPNIINI